MKKKKLIERLEEFAHGEEASVLVYIDHLQTLFERSGIKPPIAEQVSQIMDVMARDTEQHARWLHKMAEKIKMEQADDF